ncbi:catalase related subgroup domain-containing protein [Mycena sanguinolenta]|nr:catalase related subgroup domain-containing protein [Mycena sanguinolenta]
MPLPSDQKLLALSEDIIAQFDAIFGLHPGFRPAHARGIILTGSFAPSSEARALSTAPHLNRPSTPITLRFSSSSGLPAIPDTDPQGQPRGVGLRFHLSAHAHTDIVAHSTPAFPARTGVEFLELFRALAEGTVGEFVGTHPAARAFVEMPKPFPTSFAHEAYYALHAFKFTNGEGTTVFGRYTLLPDAGLQHLDDAALASKSENYLHEELSERAARGPITFHLHCQLANEGDVTDDVTAHWPKDRTVLNLGTVTLTSLVSEGDDREGQRIIFDPVPRVEGIEESEDPLFAVRAAVYLMSGRRRRAAVGK